MLASVSPIVLIVDDCVEVREVIACVLERAGFRPLAVESAGDAREALRQVTPSLILVDAHMPSLSGDEFLTELRQDPRLANIPTVLITGDIGASSAAAARGIRSLLKPFDVGRLIELAESCR